MKKYLFFYLSIIFIILSACHDNKKYMIDENGQFIEKSVFVDSISNTINEEYAWRFDSIYSEINRQNDTINELKSQIAYYQYVIDSLEEEVFLTNYKLERIAEYNRIAAQGNNITFLRGWINRVLND